MKILVAAIVLGLVVLYEVSCQSTEGPNKSCSTDTDCSNYTDTYCGFYSQCKKCRCKSGYVYDSNTTSCLLSRKLEETCTSSTQCPDSGSGSGGSCSGGSCLCGSGYIVSSDKTSCDKPKESETCTVAVGCVGSNLECTSSTCSCKTNYPQILADKTNCRQSYIDESCSADTDCLDTITNATCTSSRCACPSSSSGAAANKESCNDQVLNGACFNDGNCVAPAVCSNSTCVCNSPNVASSTTVCRKPRYGETCDANGCDTSFDSQLTCSANSNCTCNAGYVTSGVTVACAKVNIGGTCTETAECGTDAECTASKCTCKSKFSTATNGYDCTGPGYGQSCTVNSTTECTGTFVDTTCPSGGTCVCQSNYVQDTTGTTTNCRKAVYDEACTINSTECDSSLSLTCENSKCACTAGNVYDSSLNKCRNTAAVVAVTDGGNCTTSAASSSTDWTATSPVVLQCDTSLTGTAALTCYSCDSAQSVCNTAIQDPSGSVTIHASVSLVALAMVLSAFFKM